MKIKIAIIFLSVLATSFITQMIYAAPDSVQEESLQSVTLAIQNMTCAMCSITIKKALQSVDGVKNVTVDTDTKTAVVIFDTKKTTLKALITATANAGYPAMVHH